ncbi:MAG: tetratricopeptide repeat protein [Bacteroidota bacterium]
MAKKIKIKQTPTVSQPQQGSDTIQVPQQAPPVRDLRYWFYEFKPQAIILALLAFVIYFNSFFNEFAHDDGIVIVKNEYVLEGFAGIKGIMTKDAYDSYYRQLNTFNQLKGGRYRPLSIVTFAIEQQFMGPVPLDAIDSVLKQTIAYGVSGPGQEKMINNMHVRHVFNVLWYILSVVVLLYFLRYIVFRSSPLMAFIAALIFTVHPIHTEVVANVKSRDEIMSLLFMCLTFIFAFKYEEDRKKIGMLAAALGSYLLAFLSKEYAITMLGLIPLALYIFNRYSIMRALNATLPYVVVVTIYLAMRLNVLIPDNDDSTSNFVTDVFPKLAFIAGAIALVLYVRLPRKPRTDSQTFIRNLVHFLPYILLSAAFLYQRYLDVPEVMASASQEVLNNPYLFAKGDQKAATGIATTLDYLKLLIFPHPLSADYSFATIPYKHFSHPMVWLSLIVHIGLVILMFVFFPVRKAANAAVQGTGSDYVAGAKGVICFALAFYFVHLILVCNVIFDIGATMGERLIYHSSVGFAIAIAYLLVKGAERIQPAANGFKALAGVCGVIVLLCSFKTIDRNRAWKNDYTLFSTDIHTVPNSVLVNANVAASFITIADQQKDSTGRAKYLTDAIAILDHTIELHPTFVAAYLNRGIAWFKLNQVDNAKRNIDQVRKLYPTYPTLPGMYKLISDFYLRNGWEAYGKNGRYPQAIEEYKKGLAIDSNNVDLWYNMGGAYYTNRQFPEAVNSFQMALRLNPDNMPAKQGLMAAMGMLKGGSQQPQAQQPPR